jgi:hypothetical protein
MTVMTVLAVVGVVVRTAIRTTIGTSSGTTARVELVWWLSMGSFVLHGITLVLVAALAS